jgi:hypothetical protein
MNRTAVKAAAFAVLLLIGREVCAEQLSVLKQVRSSVRGVDCRVTFVFEGDVRFSSEQTGRSLRLVFPQTRPATAGAIVRKDLSSGPVHSIAFTRTADGSLVATLTLAKGSSYRCVSPAGGQELYVDVHGEAGARSAIAGSSVPGQDRSATTAGMKRSTPSPVSARTQSSSAPAVKSLTPGAREPGGPAGGAGRGAERTAAGSSKSTLAKGMNPNDYSPVKVSLIDIPAMAMSQVETASQETAPELASPSEAAQASSLSTGMALLVSLLVSLVSTATALSAWYLMRRNALKRISRREVREDAAPHAAVRPADESETEYRGRSEEEARMLKDLIRTSTQEEIPEEEYEQETSLQLARTFKRGSEEIALAQRLHDHGAPALTPERLNTVLSHATTSTRRVQAARKMGVGRGEFDLALKLKSMADEKKEAHR